MVIGGAAEYFCSFTLVCGLAGHPALTATSLAWVCSLAFAEWAELAVVEVEDCDPTDLLPLDTANAMPTIAPATTRTMMPLRIRTRRFLAWASATNRASRAARWRARFSLGTGADPIQSPSDPPVAPGVRPDPREASRSQRGERPIPGFAVRKR